MTAEPKMTIAQIEALMDQGFAGWRKLAEITALGDGSLTARMPHRPQLMRSGGTISGPALMTLADTTAFWITLAYAGPVPSAATSNLNISFLARPGAADVIATARILRMGKRLAVSTVELRSDGSDDLVAHATVSYALPSFVASQRD